MLIFSSKILRFVAYRSLDTLTIVEAFFSVSCRLSGDSVVAEINNNSWKKVLDSVQRGLKQAAKR